MQLLRITVDPGLHTLRVVPDGSGESFEKTVQVKAGGKVFVPFRYIPR
jgi:hypothetical protein